ncbi:hypothetical protein JOC55_002752 [Paenibacillus sacheonensis]|nr:hypothetical protein [Paenibacillus sacheonensis]
MRKVQIWHFFLLEGLVKVKAPASGQLQGHGGIEAAAFVSALAEAAGRQPSEER